MQRDGRGSGGDEVRAGAGSSCAVSVDRPGCASVRAADSDVEVALLRPTISFDWTEVDLSASDFKTKEQIESFLNGKMTNSRLKEVRYFEIVWKDSAGKTWTTSRTRNADGTVNVVATVTR